MAAAVSNAVRASTRMKHRPLGGKKEGTQPGDTHPKKALQQTNALSGALKSRQKGGEQQGKNTRENTDSK